MMAGYKRAHCLRIAPSIRLVVHSPADTPFLCGTYAVLLF